MSDQNDILDITDDSDLKCVEIDALVVMRIMKHCNNNLPAVSTGILLGLDVETDLQVTNCFETPNAKDGEADDEYQVDMMRHLRDVNVDSNAVGWYQSAYLGNYLEPKLVESMFLYQESMKKSVVVIFDPMQDSIGKAPLKAFRLRGSFLKSLAIARETNDPSQLRNMPSDEVFQEIPIAIHNSLLVESFVMDWANNNPACKFDQFEHLDMENESFLEKNMHFLLECLDELGQEQQKLQFYERQAARMKVRKARGEDIGDAERFNTMQMPTQLETLLISNQIQTFCKQINNYTADSFGKLFLTSGFQKAN